MMKKILSVFVILAIVAVTSATSTEAISSRFDNYIRRNLSSLNITSEQLAEMIETGRIRKDVVKLSLANNQITDLSPLAELTNLRELFLNNNQISDLMPLAGLTNLQSLNLYDNQIIDISPLANLTNLGGPFGALGLSGNQISDLSPLSGLTKLHWLMMYDNNISDLTPLESLTNLNLSMIVPATLRGNNVTDEQIEALKEAIRRNQDNPSMMFIRAYLQAHPQDSMELAVEILKYIVGLPTGELFDVVRIDAGFEPSIGDAVEILKFVVGLESMVDDG
jgi:hypothetical protein